MAKIICKDFFDNEYEVDENDILDRRSAYAVIFYKGGLLLQKDSWSKRWGIPGGAVESGETIKKSAARETFEETGIKINPVELKRLDNWIEYWYSIDTKQAYRSFRSFFFIELDVVDGDLLNDGNGEDSIKAEFINIHELSKIELRNSDRNLIKKALELIKTTN